MTYKTDGIVIREQPWRENDKIITILTSDLGVIRSFANGCRSKKSRFSASTSLFAYSSFTVGRNKSGVFSVREAETKEVFFRLRDDIVSLYLASYIAELAYEFSPREEDASKQLSLVLNSFFLLCGKKKPPKLIKAVAQMRLACDAGYMPSIVGCDVCGEYTAESMFFSVSDGKLRCGEHAEKNRSLPISASALAAMRHICFSDDKKVFSFTLPDRALDELDDLCERYILGLVSARPKTLSLYKETAG